MTLHLVKVLILKRDMSRQTGCFQYTKLSQNLGMILKRGMTIHLLKVLILKRDMSRQTGCFQYTKSSQNLGMILKRGVTIHLQNRIDPKESHGSFYW